MNSDRRDSHLLIVSDDAALARETRAAARALGLGVTTTDDPLEPLRRLDAAPPPLIVIALRLPGLSTMELAEIIRFRSKSTPLVVICPKDTAPTERARRLLDGKSMWLLHEPLESGRLRTVLAEALGDRAQSYERRRVAANGMVPSGREATTPMGIPLPGAEEPALRTA